MTLVEILHDCYLRGKNTCTIFREERFQQAKEKYFIDLTSEEIGNELLIRISKNNKKTRTHRFQLRIKHAGQKRVYYVGINRRPNQISVEYVHSTRMAEETILYLWKEDLTVKNQTSGN